MMDLSATERQMALNEVKQKYAVIAFTQYVH